MAVHRNARQLVDLAAESNQLPIEELIERYGNQWLATARRSSPTAADTEDAYQRALEVLITKPPATRDSEGIAAWMHTVIRNEALQITRSRRREVDAEFEVIADGLTADAPEPEESVVDAETHRVSKEALRRLRPDQTRCLLLRADGFDYPEICKLTGFSYAKVNRLLSEGRKAAHMRVHAIETGRECQRIEPLLSMVADGVAEAAHERDVRMHIEGCTHCRATLRDYTLTPRDLAAILPVGLPLADPGLRERLLEPLHRLAEFLQGSAAGGAGDSTLALGKKALAVLAVCATAVGGKAVVDHERSDVQRSATAKSSAASTHASARQLAARRERSAARQRRRAAASGKREERIAAAQAEQAAANNDAPAAAPLNAGTDAGGDTAADPAAEAPPQGAVGTDGQAEGLAP